MHFTRKQTFSTATPGTALVCSLSDFPMDSVAITAAFTGTSVSGPLNILYTADGGSEQTVRDEFGVAVTILANAPVVVVLRDMGRASQLRFTDGGLVNVTAYTITING